MSESSQLLSSIKEIVNNAEEKYREGAECIDKVRIPDSENIPQRGNKWNRVNNVISVFIDMCDSTALSVSKHAKSTAEIYQYFTDTIVRICKIWELHILI